MSCAPSDPHLQAIGPVEAPHQVPPGPRTVPPAASSNRFAAETVPVDEPDRRRVLVVVPQLRLGGAEKQAVLLSKRLRARGYEVEVATFYQGGEYENELRESGVPIFLIEKKTRIGWEVVTGLRRLLRGGRYDLTHSFLWSANWRLQLAARLIGTCRVVVSTRGFQSNLGRCRLLTNRFLLPKPDLTVVNAEALRSHLVKDLGLRPSQVRVVRNGVELEEYRRLPTPGEVRHLLGIPLGRKVLGSVGNFSPVKNQEDLLRVLARVRATIPDTLLVLVGSGEREALLRRMAQDLGLGGAIIFAGQSQRVPEYLAAMDVFLNSSLREGCCNAILEAMAAARPVLAYRVGGNSELVLEGETGHLFASGAWEEMAERAIELLRDPARGRALGAAGRLRVTTNFDPEEMVSRTEELYGEILGTRSRGRTSIRAVVGVAVNADKARSWEVDVSVIMPVRNEARHLRESLGAVLAQDIGPGSFEVLVVDGQSTDGTREIVQEFMRDHSSVRLLDNPGRIVPTGMNIGLSEARGEFVVRVDGHCVIRPDYLRAAAETLRVTGCEGVGGRMEAVGENFWGRAIAAATSCPFGVGNARFHYSDAPGEADTVYLGAYRRDHLRQIGGYDPAFVRNQDDELNYRIRTRGGRIFYSPRMRSRYRVRPSLSRLFRQYFEYGLWKVPMYRKTGHPVKARHLAPAGLLAALLGPLLLAPWFPGALWITAVTLALHLLLGGVWASRSEGEHGSSLGIPIVFLTLHTAYGLGFLAGCLRPPIASKGAEEPS